jgi:uncharacterized protein DUF3501
VNAITRDSLMSLEEYARQRSAFRRRVIEHKKQRTVALGPNLTLVFEDELTIRYQIQEMLRIEKTFEEAGIIDELEVYLPLVPGGADWKATMMLEYPDPDVRKHWLERLKGVEDRVWVRLAGFDSVFAIADEDLERENETKTSAVHFLRFPLSQSMVAAMQAGAGLAMGVDHPEYQHQMEAVAETVRRSLCEDLKP